MCTRASIAQVSGLKKEHNSLKQVTEGLIFFLFLPSLNKKQTSPLGSSINKVKLIFKKASFEFTRALLTFHERIHQMPPCG